MSDSPDRPTHESAFGENTPVREDDQGGERPQGTAAPGKPIGTGVSVGDRAISVIAAAASAGTIVYFAVREIVEALIRDSEAWLVAPVLGAVVSETVAHATVLVALTAAATSAWLNSGHRSVGSATLRGSAIGIGAGAFGLTAGVILVEAGLQNIATIWTIITAMFSVGLVIWSDPAHNIGPAHNISLPLFVRDKQARVQLGQATVALVVGPIIFLVGASAVAAIFFIQQSDENLWSIPIQGANQSRRMELAGLTELLLSLATLIGVGAGLLLARTSFSVRQDWIAPATISASCGLSWVAIASGSMLGADMGISEILTAGCGSMAILASILLILTVRKQLSAWIAIRIFAGMIACGIIVYFVIGEAIREIILEDRIADLRPGRAYWTGYGTASVAGLIGAIVASITAAWLLWASSQRFGGGRGIILAGILAISSGCITGVMAAQIGLDGPFLIMVCGLGLILIANSLGEAMLKMLISK